VSGRQFHTAKILPRGARRGMKKSKHPASNIQHPTSNEAGNELWVFREGDATQRRYDLEERLLEFSSAVIDLSEKLPNTRAGNHIAGQILRSGTSPYPNHGEAEEAESRDDFIHKLKVCLKELRETLRWARLVRRKAWAKDDPTLVFLLREADELIRIFFSSIQTARRNALAEKRPAPEPVRYPPTKSG
jgi:four helix bundle protein